MFLPGYLHGQKSLTGYSPCGPKELDMTEQLSIHSKGNGTDEPICSAGYRDADREQTCGRSKGRRGWDEQRVALERIHYHIKTDS